MVTVESVESVIFHPVHARTFGALFLSKRTPLKFHKGHTREGKGVCGEGGFSPTPPPSPPLLPWPHDRDQALISEHQSRGER